MALSGSYNYLVSATDIITEALELIGAYDVGTSPSNDDIGSCLRTLNMMVKNWQADNFYVWKEENCVLFQEYDENEYSIGPTGDHSSTSYVKTEVSTAAASAATAVAVDSATGVGDTFDRNGIITATTPTGASDITLSGVLVSGLDAILPSARRVCIYSDGDDSGVTFTIEGTDGNGDSQSEEVTGPNTTTVYSTYNYLTVDTVSISGAGTGNIEVGCVGDFIGIELDDYSLQWSNITTISGTTINFADALTDDVAIDNHVYTYSSKVQRPLEITEARLRNSDAKERDIDVVSRKKYMGMSDKDSRGAINSIYYKPSLTNGKVYTWGACNDVQEVIKFTAKIPIQDFDSQTNNPDCPKEWYLPLAHNLAVLIARKFTGKDMPELFEMRAINMKESCFNLDKEHGSIFFKVKQ